MTGSVGSIRAPAAPTGPIAICLSALVKASVLWPNFALDRGASYDE
jgi:hypothetical protein